MLTTVIISSIDKITWCYDKELYQTQSIFQAKEHLHFHKFLHPLNPELGLKKKKKSLNQQLQYSDCSALYILQESAFPNNRVIKPLNIPAWNL